MKPLPHNSSIVTSAANFIIESINNVLKPWENLCKKLYLDQVTEAMRKVNDNNDNNNKVVFQTDNKEARTRMNQTNNYNYFPLQIQLQLTLITIPGQAVFEATVYGDVLLNRKNNRNNNRNWKVSGEISRLNIYSDQSSCIDDPMAQKYCFCTTKTTEN
jgi:hypothetical protein